MELRDANDELIQKSRPLNGCRPWPKPAETASEAWEALRMSSRQTKDADDQRIEELEEASRRRRVTADAVGRSREEQEVEKVHST